jgi:hypothetical protein
MSIGLNFRIARRSGLSPSPHVRAYYVAKSISSGVAVDFKIRKGLRRDRISNIEKARPSVQNHRLLPRQVLQGRVTEESDNEKFLAAFKDASVLTLIRFEILKNLGNLRVLGSFQKGLQPSFSL